MLNTVLITLTIFIFGYIIGNISFARIASKYIIKIDITKVGSKNPGGTNLTRVSSVSLGVFIMCLDSIKAIVASLLALLLKEHTEQFRNVIVVFGGFGVIIGHCWPIIYKFKGGKGAAAFSGMIFMINPISGAIAFFVWILLNIITKYVSLSTLLTILLCTILTIIPIIGQDITVIQSSIYHLGINNYTNLWWITTIICFISLLIITFKHRTNIKRLINKNESVSWIVKLIKN